jgi:hypothetical protein
MVYIVSHAQFKTASGQRASLFALKSVLQTTTKKFVKLADEEILLTLWKVK